jgi:hypothetical protein
VAGLSSGVTMCLLAAPTNVYLSCSCCISLFPALFESKLRGKLLLLLHHLASLILKLLSLLKVKLLAVPLDLEQVGCGHKVSRRGQNVSSAVILASNVLTTLDILYVLLNEVVYFKIEYILKKNQATLQESTLLLYSSPITFCPETFSPACTFVEPET